MSQTRKHFDSFFEKLYIIFLDWDPLQTEGRWDRSRSPARESPIHSALYAIPLAPPRSHRSKITGPPPPPPRGAATQQTAPPPRCASSVPRSPRDRHTVCGSTASMRRDPPWLCPAAAPSTAPWVACRHPPRPTHTRLFR